MAAYANRHQQKRHGKHQKHTRHFLKVYSPYLPLMMIIMIGLYIGSLMPPKINHSVAKQPNKDVLAYATSMSSSGLLSSTNTERAKYGAAALKINSKLASAAQQKANDMIAKDYWSHDPPGCPKAGTCWYEFVNSSGYAYRALGENLAYGFESSAATVSGWMASPEHRANMLNKVYTEVGFGYANGSNFNHSGPETVVVAEYAQPANLAPAPLSTSSSGGSTKASNITAPVSSQSSATPKASKTPTKTPAKSTPSTSTDTPSLETVAATPSVKVSRLSYLTNGNFPWLATMITVVLVASLAALALRHIVAIRKWIKNGEKYVLHHALFDITIVSLIGLCVLLNQSPNLFVH